MARAVPSTNAVCVRATDHRLFDFCPAEERKIMCVRMRPLWTRVPFGIAIVWGRRLVAGALASLTVAFADPGFAEAQIPDSTLVPDSTQPADSTQATDSLRSAARLPEAVLLHLAHLAEAFFDTPRGMGLIETAMAEAEIAARYVSLAGQDATNLGRMIGNMSHVLHAIDPVEVGNGFGLGYGVRRAAEGVLLHIDLATSVEGVSDNVVFHAGYITAAASAALVRANAAIALARQVQRATTPGEALPLIERLADLVRTMAYGDDADRDGRIGYPDTESGLAQARYHLRLIRRVAGLAG